MVGNFILVMAGGAIGAALRYSVSIFGPHLWGENFPWATLAVNGLGCFIIGLFLAFGSQKNFETTHLLVAVGVLGSLTTFSTFSVESIQMLMEDRQLAAAGNIIGNLIISLAACSCGVLLGRLFSS